MATLYRPDQKELIALGQLVKMPHGKALVEVLEAELKVTQLRMLDTSETDLIKLQGRGKFLLDFLTLLREQAKTQG